MGTTIPTIVYIPARISSVLDNYKVIEITAAAYPPNLIEGTSTKTNHWILHLVTSPRTSVRLDMTPTDTSNIGRLAVSELLYVISLNAVKVCSFSVAEGC